MDATKFAVTSFGRPARRPGDKWAFTYFLPNALPRDLDIDRETALAMSEADSALGHLQGLGRLLPEPHLLIGPFLTREALASSRIEGTKASLSDVLKADDVVKEETDDIAEVQRYVAASRLGFQLIESLPISQRLLLQVHEVLMAGVRGEEKQPGTVRRTPVWIGSARENPETADFVPPLPEHLPELLTDWEKFVNEPVRTPVLVKCALMHYQFETIHPFLDGNGRIGRLLISLLLTLERRLTTPLLYLSGYLETHRQEYYDRLQAVRERGEIQEWIQFFCTAVARQADDAVTRAGYLVELREKYLSQSSQDRSSTPALIPLIFTNPYLTAGRITRELGVTPQSARNLLSKAEKRGWIQYQGSVGQGRRHFYVAQEIFNALDSPVMYR